MVFGFSKKKKKEPKKNEIHSGLENNILSENGIRSKEKLLSKEQVAELLLLEDLVDKMVEDENTYTKICSFYMVTKVLFSLS